MEPALWLYLSTCSDQDCYEELGGLLAWNRNMVGGTAIGIILCHFVAYAYNCYARIYRSTPGEVYELTKEKPDLP